MTGTLPDLTRIGSLQRAVVAELARHPNGRTTREMAYLSGCPTLHGRVASLGKALRSLEDRGLAVIGGRTVPATGDGRGQQPKVWVLTRAGRLYSEFIAGTRALNEPAAGLAEAIRSEREAGS